MIWRKFLAALGAATTILMLGCATNYAADEAVSKPSAGGQPKQMEREGVRTNLNGMSDEEIKQYAEAMIARGKMFIYTGGFTNMPIVAEEDRAFAKTMDAASVGCTGGFTEAGKFNKIIIQWVQANHPQKSDSHLR